MRRRQTVHALALALIVSLVSGYEVLEIVLWIFDIANFVILIDEVAVIRQALS